MRIYLKARILPAFGKMPLDSIGPEDVAAWFDTASKDKPGAANRAFEIMRAMMFRAEEWGLRKRDSNPCLGIAKNPRNNIARFLDTDGLARLGRALDAREAEWPEAVAAIRLLAFTGCRRSEVLNLRCLDIGAKEISLPDGKTGPRTVPLGRAARAHIDALPGGMNPHGFLFPKYAEGRIQHILREGIVKLTDCRLFSAFLHEAKPLKLLRAAFDNFQDFGVDPVNLTKPADIIRLLLLTGCRRSEIVRLRWSEVDHDKLVLADSKTGPRTVLPQYTGPADPRTQATRRKPLRLSVPERPRPAPQPKPSVLVSRPARGGHRGSSPSRSSAYPCQPRGDERHPGAGRFPAARPFRCAHDAALRPSGRPGNRGRGRACRSIHRSGHGLVARLRIAVHFGCGGTH